MVNDFTIRADVSRYSNTNEAIGFYDPIVDFLALPESISDIASIDSLSGYSFDTVSGLNNTLAASKTIIGIKADSLFGKNYDFFDINFTFDASFNEKLEDYGINVGSFSISSNQVDFTLLNNDFSFTRDTIDGPNGIVDRLVGSGISLPVAQSIRNDFVTAINFISSAEAGAVNAVAALSSLIPNVGDLGGLPTAAKVNLSSETVSSDGSNDFADISAYNFVSFVATSFDDELTGSSELNGFWAGLGDDLVDGGLNHDELHGGLGNDTIEGGDGADFLYDNGANNPKGKDESDEAYLIRLLAYDTDGDDELSGGKGADVFLHSGGTDTFEGGAGNDIYFTVEEVDGSYNNQDNLTIILSEDSEDSETFFGNDLIRGTGRGVDLVRFEGISSDDVEIRYQFEERAIGSTLLDIGTPQFVSFFEDWRDGAYQPRTAEYYQTVGSVEIYVTETGSSLTVEQVLGTHVRGDNGSSFVSIDPRMAAPFTVQFDDGLMDWRGEFLDAGNNSYTFESTELSDTAFNARNELEDERAVPDNEINHDDDDLEDPPFEEDDVDLIGSYGSDSITGGDESELIRGRDGSDIILGGGGADTIDGGIGVDTASYSNAPIAVSAYLDADRPSFSNPSGDAEGDVYISVENLVGSNFNDRLYGDFAGNRVEGGSGNDTIFGLGGFDTLIGGDGDDSINAGDYRDADSNVVTAEAEVFGGAGSDTIRSSSGSDRLYGEEGDDTFELGSFVSFSDPLTPGNDTIDGGAGTDRAEFFYGSVVVDLVAGTAEYTNTGEIATLLNVEDIQGSREDDLIIGDDGNNVIDGDGGNDTILGGGGDDQLYASSSRDDAFVFGGSGIDTAHIEGSGFGFDEANIDVIEGGLVISKSNDLASVSVVI